VIHLDHNATSPLLPEVLDAMRPWLGVPANPASAHRSGQAAAAAVERARAHVAALVGGNPAGVVFTSGATEANHLAIYGLVAKAGRRGWMTSAIEHPCVHDAARRWAEPVATLPVGPDGRARIVALPADLAGLSLMAANHETGVLQPIDEAAAAARAVGAALHVDATQAAGRVPLALGDVDAVALSSHKLGGPAGVGALVLRDGEPFGPLLGGGGHERGRRAGTVNTAGVVGFGEACRIAAAASTARAAAWGARRARLEAALVALGGRIVGAEAPRVANTTLVIFAGLRADGLVQALDLAGFATSAGAACASGSLRPSPVLAAMGDAEPTGGLRISLGPSTTDDDLSALFAALPAVLDAAREAASWEEDGG
jgi:cysteine desulfurase